MSILSATIILYVLMGPVGNIPIFLGFLQNVDPKRRPAIIMREMLFVLIVLVVFLFGGKFILQLFHIADPALTIAGGVVLFLISLKLIFSSPEHIFAGDSGQEPFIVPLAIPSVAGPSIIITLMLFVTREPHRWAEWLLSLAVAWIAMTLTLLAANRCARMLNDRLLKALQRLMGMLLTTIAVQMLLSGIRSFVVDIMTHPAVVGG